MDEFDEPSKDMIEPQGNFLCLTTLKCLGNQIDSCDSDRRLSAFSRLLSANQQQPWAVFVKVFFGFWWIFLFWKVKLFLVSVSSSAWWRVSCSCCTVTDDQCDSTSCSPVQVCVCYLSILLTYLSPSLCLFSSFLPLCFLVCLLSLILFSLFCLFFLLFSSHFTLLSSSSLHIIPPSSTSASVLHHLHFYFLCILFSFTLLLLPLLFLLFFTFPLPHSVVTLSASVM